jgi:hypothetical protein
MLGNSYTGGNLLGRMIEQLAAAAGESLFSHSIAPGGVTFEFHCTHPATLSALVERPWDIVTLQDQSLRPIDEPDKTVAFGLNLVKLIEQAVGRKPRLVLYLSWPRKQHPEKLPALEATYRRLADTVGATIAPCGPAWKLARAALPHLEFYQEDLHHPEPVATYLNACVFFATIYGRSPVGLPSALHYRWGNFWNYEAMRPLQTLNLSESDTRALQQFAWDAVQAEKARVAG